MAKYEFDTKNFNFEKVTHSIWDVVLTVLKWAVGITAMAALGYLIIAVFVSTDTEKQLRRENRAYEKVWSDMKRREKLVSRVVVQLQDQDNAIYGQVFHAKAPSLEAGLGSVLNIADDTIPERNIVEYTAAKADAIDSMAFDVEENFKAVFSALAQGKARPPMKMPLPDISYTQIGASVGTKVNPFLKVGMSHQGIDIIAPQGESVLASAPGKVIEVTRSRKGQGNVVGISHEGGYVTRYAHLGKITVSKGQTVAEGQKIGEVGISGKTFAPHLHYEVLRDTVAQDPVNYMFSSIGPEQYARMTYMSVNTEQSLD